MSSPELDRLIVEHIVDLDSAATRTGPIEQRIWAAHAEALEDWSHANGWVGDFDIEKDLTAGAAHWEVDERKQAWFGMVLSA
ncbi:hypothetical protein RM53_14185 [Brevundimonas nasdae]|uniref:Uncharacterized protein n=1 Tax=Brevundimonas nasdae TaxID=172043 RepID=A0A0B4C4L6_9CAUL|nr:hypothetical protein [Brevundimonas nasdae]KIC55979.1 hypothetical protein RM53_14185 [Brevundimonas nasdae]